MAIPSSATEIVVQSGQVEHDPVRRRPPREAMPTTTRNQVLTGSPREGQALDDIRHRAALQDVLRLSHASKLGAAPRRFLNKSSRLRPATAGGDALQGRV